MKIGSSISSSSCSSRISFFKKIKESIILMIEMIQMKEEEMSLNL